MGKYLKSGHHDPDSHRGQLRHTAPRGSDYLTHNQGNVVSLFCFNYKETNILGKFHLHSVHNNVHNETSTLGENASLPRLDLV